MPKAKRVFMTIVLLFLVTSLTKSIFDFVKNQRFYQAYKEEFEQTEKEHIELQTALVKAQDSNEYEKNIRNNLNYHKEGERIVLVPDISPTPLPITPTSPPVYVQWSKVFFSH